MHQAKSAVETYKESAFSQGRYFDDLLSFVKIEKGWNVLDFGCGTGNNTIRLANMVGPKGKVVGIDPIVERIELAKEKNCANNIEYHVGYGQDVSKFVKNQKFDLVVAGTVMHWISPEEKPKVFKSVFDQLVSGGKFLFNHLQKGTSNWGWMFDVMKDQKYKSDFYSRCYKATLAEYEMIAVDAGFMTCETCEEKTTRTYYESVVPIMEQVAASIHTVDFDELLSELRSILNNDDIDKSLLYDEEGRPMFQVDQFFVKYCKP